MKRLILLSAFLVVAFPVFAVNRAVLVVDDVIRMTKASVADDQIIEFVRTSAAPFEVSGDDVIAMNDAHVSPAVMKFVIDESAARMKAARTEPAQNGSNETTRVVVQHQYPVYAGPTYPSAYPYYYDPYYAGYPYYRGYYPYYGYPYYYGYPGVSFGIGFGYYGSYYGGYYGHGGHYGGGRGGHGGGGHPGNGGHHGGHGGSGGHH